MEKKIGFIGLGSMGLNMAKKLIQEGYHLQVYNRTISKANELDANHITLCHTPAQAAKDVKVVISMLSEDEILKEIVLGENGLLQTLAKNNLHISMSTISSETSELLNKHHQNVGNYYLAAPVFGRPEAILTKSIYIATSGVQEAKTMAQPILACLSQGVFDFGETAGGANVIKITGNFMLLALLEMMAESFTLAEKNGLDRLKVMEFFGSTLFNFPIFKNYGKLIAQQEYKNVGFKTKLGYKDACLTLKLLQASKTPMPMANLLHTRLLTAMAKGLNETDWAEAVGRGVKEDAGL